MEYYTYLYKDTDGTANLREEKKRASGIKTIPWNKGIKQSPETLQLYRLTYYRAQRAQDKFNKQVFEY
jgi:hypothetical protein